MPREKTALYAAAAYVWVAMVACGGIAVETIVIYPNVFHDAPASLDQAAEFFAVVGPADFFPPMGVLTALLGLATLALLWPQRTSRLWIGASLGSLILGEAVYSMLFFWPRNEIMFEEGTAVHSVEFLRQTATEFEIGHWGRLAASAVTATLAFVGFLRFHRQRVLSTAREHTDTSRSFHHG